MASSSKLQASIKLLHGDKIATIDALTASFSSDYSDFARANNRENLNSAVSELKKSPKDKVIGEAITEAYKVGGLVTGYIGARSGKYSVQPDDIKAVYEGAIIGASEAFRDYLTQSEAFAEKSPKTTEEKEKAKTEKAEKAEKAKNDLITAMVQSGELVRASDIKKLEDFGQLALIEALKIQGLDVQALQAEHQALQAEHQALQAEHQALQAEHQARKTSKVKKALTA